MALIKESETRNFYKVFCPTQISVNSDASPMLNIDIIGEEDFINNCSKYADKNIYACFNPLNGTRNSENVIALNFIFLDSDDAETFDELKKELESLNIKPSFISRSGPEGHHIFIRLPNIQLNSNNRTEETKYYHNFVSYLARKGLTDEKCKDIGRLCRVWGSINQKGEYKDKVYCELEQNFIITEQEIMNNYLVMKNLSAEMQEIVYTGAFDDVSFDECLFLEAVIKDDYDITGKTGTKFNDKLGKNLAIYCYNKFGEEKAINVMRRIYAKKNHPLGAADGWIKKAKRGAIAKISCHEISSQVKEFYPECDTKHCDKCRRDNKNNIIYLSEKGKSFDTLKREFSSKRFKDNFFINDSQEFHGIVKQSYRGDTKTTIPLVKVFISKLDEKCKNMLLDVDNLDDETVCIYFGEFKKSDETSFQKKHKLLKEVKANMFTYFIKENDGANEYALFSERKIPLGACQINGMLVFVKDRMKLHEFSTFEVSKGNIFVHSFKTKTKKYRSLLEIPVITSDELIRELYLYNDTDRGINNITFDQPRWLKMLVLSTIFSGVFLGYPLHLMICGPPSCGKSRLIEALSNRFEDQIIDMTTSTLKGLVPSYKATPPQSGKLNDARRIAPVDELLSKIFHKDIEKVQEFVMMNNILECKSLIGSSGSGEVPVSMKAKMICSTNPIATKTFQETMECVPPSFFQRVLIINLGKDMLEWIGDYDKHMYEEYEAKLRNEELQGMFDYFNSFVSRIDKDKVKAIMNEILPRVPSFMKDFVQANDRMTMHHAVLLLDGIVKIRCIDNRKEDFTASDDDYNELKSMLNRIIDGWRSKNYYSYNDLSTEQRFILDNIKDGIKKELLFDICESKNIKPADVFFLIDISMIREENGHYIINKKAFNEIMEWKEIINDDI